MNLCGMYGLFQINNHISGCTALVLTHDTIWISNLTVHQMQLKNNNQRTQIETDSTSFGHITTQQSQPLNKVTIRPNILDVSMDMISAQASSLTSN